jgi:hypothetical protein
MDLDPRLDEVRAQRARRDLQFERAVGHAIVVPPEGPPSGASNPSQRAGPTGQFVRYLNRTYLLPTVSPNFVDKSGNLGYIFL